MVTQISAFTRSCNEGISRILISDVYVSEIYYTTNRPQNLIIKKYTAIWDTGATNTVITKKVMMECKLWSIGMTKVIHAGGEATTNSYLVNLYLPNNLEVRGVRVSEGILGEKVDVLIGMDIISKGDFAVTNYNGRTVFTFRYPSVECIDFVKTPYKEKPIKVTNKIGRNDPCPCGSGKKYKHCCLKKNNKNFKK
jgi:hypothetical protein